MIDRLSAQPPSNVPKVPSRTMLLTASPSFCNLSKFAEVPPYTASFPPQITHFIFQDEILGQNIVKLLPEPVVTDENTLRCMLIQPPSVRVSPILKVQPHYRVKDGSYIHTSASVQHFYAADGTISFMVIGVEKFAYADDITSPFMPQQADFITFYRGNGLTYSPHPTPAATPTGDTPSDNGWT